ncbi:MAG: hypothetical protein LBV41_07225 [Cytophagaceae bacterium]|jgi:hypothetical protein|nr:hypothetical protein [Cytophagaceae bacterium]
MAKLAENSERRAYKCKDEELPVICSFVSHSVNRDKEEFASYSPKFNDTYFSEFNTKITDVINIVIPTTETTEMKIITDRMHTTMHSLSQPIDHLNGYIEMAGSELHITASDFGIPALRERIKAGDAEGVMKNLRLLAASVKKYNAVLNKLGFTLNQLQKFETAHKDISIDRQEQYKILEGRKAIVQTNRNLFNALYYQMKEICNIGKIIFKLDPIKMSEYTFEKLKHKVGNTSRSSKTSELSNDN